MLFVDNNENTIVDTFDKIESVEIIKEGVSTTYTGDQLSQFVAKLQNTFSDGRLMPAFGVSIHNLTIKEMKNGNWVKLNFNGEQEKNGLPFTSLLFHVEDGYGMNLIREYNGKYDGRCIYISFDENTEITNLLK